MDHPREEAKRVLLLLLAVAGTTVLTLMVSATPSKGAKPEPCPPGRYFVLNQSLLPADASSSDEAVVVGGTAISIGAACRAIPVKVWLSKSGTKIRARWKGCAGLQGKVRLRATIDDTCSIMAGTLIARKLKFRRHFAARLSICGDGILDIARGEQCEGSIGCSPGEVCTGCVCVANQNTTTTTSYIPSSTTSSSSSSTTSASTSTTTGTTQPPTTTTTTSTTTTSQAPTTTTTNTSTTTTTTTAAPTTSTTTTQARTTTTTTSSSSTTQAPTTSTTTSTTTTSQPPTTTTTNTSTISTTTTAVPTTSTTTTQARTTTTTTSTTTTEAPTTTTST